MRKYLFQSVVMVKIDNCYVDEDILDRLEGMEAYHDDYGNTIFNISDIENTLNNKDDDTNEDTLYRISQFLKAAKAYKAEKILIVA